MTALIFGIIVFAYLFGSISSAVLVCCIAGLPDPREAGSHNPGATNVLRIGGRLAALIVLIFDILKGMLPTWLAYKLAIPAPYLGLIAIAACLGHIYPIFFHFKGGKGVATAFGAMAPISWALASMLVGTWVLVVLISGYSSLGAIVTALLAPLYVWYFGHEPQLILPVAMLSCLVIIRHHDNIQRIWRGQESHIWDKFRKKSKEQSK